MSYVMFENRSSKPAQFVELAWHDAPYFFASRREGEVGTWGEWDYYEDDELMGWEIGQAWDEVVSRGKEQLGSDWEITKQSDEPGMDVSAAWLEARYGVQFPDRLRKFYDTGEWKTHQGATTVDPPMWSCTFTMSFDSLGLHLMTEMFEMTEDAERKRFIPLSPLIGGDTQEYLAVDITDDSAPVFMWYHGSGKFYPYKDSLDAFLDALC